MGKLFFMKQANAFNFKQLQASAFNCKQLQAGAFEMLLTPIRLHGRKNR
jgi:hypothetical protein